jgi:hypothetical protein
MCAKALITLISVYNFCWTVTQMAALILVVVGSSINDGSWLLEEP